MEAATNPTLSYKEREDQVGELQAGVPSGRGGKDGGVCSRRTDT